MSAEGVGTGDITVLLSSLKEKGVQPGHFCCLIAVEGPQSVKGIKKFCMEIIVLPDNCALLTNIC